MKIVYQLLFIVFGFLISCQTSPESSVILPQESQAAAKASLVAILSSGAQTADIVIKYSQSLAINAWQLTAQNTTGAEITLQPGSDQSLTHFTLSTRKAAGLIVGHSYRFTLRFLYNQTDTLTVERLYTHRLPSSWRQRAHIDIEDGDFTGMLAANGVPPAGTSTNLVLLRYVDEQNSNRIIYTTDQDSWVINAVKAAIPHRLVLFNLTKPGFNQVLFSGLGYLMDDRIPQLRVYTKKIYRSAKPHA